MENDENKKIISSTTGIFTLSVVFIAIFNLIFKGLADEISQYSELFSLCGQGLSIKTLAELLLMSFVISLVRYFWFSDKFFKNMLMFQRITLMVISTFLLAAIFSAVFCWFPIGMWEAWLGFIISFIVSTIISYSIMMIISRIESGKYQKVLDEYKNKEDKRT